MRLLNYLSYSGIDEDTNKFRMLTLMLVDKPPPYSEIILKIIKEHNITEILKLPSSLNKELKNIYKGKYFFDFCIDEGSDINILKLRKKNYEKLKILHLKSNDVLSLYKKQVENNLLQSVV